MTITGYLSEYSLPELLYLLEVGNRTGYLRLQTQEAIDGMMASHCFIWFNQGRIASAFKNKQGRNLVQLIHQRKLLALEKGLALLRRSPVESPFGTFLKAQGLLTAEELNLLFSIQVIHHIRALFTLEDAWFRFNDDPELPYSEMTGLSVQATGVILPGLRALRNWTALESRLPNPESGLSQGVSQPIKMCLKSLEQRVWWLSDGQTALHTIAQDLEVPLDEVRRVAFCLINAGLVEEVPLTVLPTLADTLSLFPEEGESKRSNASESPMSQAFVSTLEGYLSSLS